MKNSNECKTQEKRNLEFGIWYEPVYKNAEYKDKKIRTKKQEPKDKITLNDKRYKT